MRALYPLDTIRYVLHGGMRNIVAAIFSENLEPIMSVKRTAPAKEGVSTWQVKARVQYDGERVNVLATVPVCHPDKVVPWFRIDPNAIVKIDIDGGRKHFVYEAWCECDDMLGLDIHQVIVRMARPVNGFEWWMTTVGAKVHFRGAYDSLPLNNKETVAEKWSHLPHVCINTERRAQDRTLSFARFRSQGTQ